MIQDLFTCLWITMGITSLIGITGLVLSILGNTSRKYLQISGSYLYLEYFAFWFDFLGGDKNTGGSIRTLVITFLSMIFIGG